MEIKKIEDISKRISNNYPSINKNYEKNINWFKKNRDKLSRYENNWIAINDEQVIAFSSNPYELEKEIQSKSSNVSDIMIYFLSDSNCIF